MIVLNVRIEENPQTENRLHCRDFGSRLANDFENAFIRAAKMYCAEAKAGRSADLVVLDYRGMVLTLAGAPGDPGPWLANKINEQEPPCQVQGKLIGYGSDREYLTGKVGEAPEFIGDSIGTGKYSPVVFTISPTA